MKSLVRFVLHMTEMQLRLIWQIIVMLLLPFMGTAGELEDLLKRLDGSSRDTNKVNLLLDITDLYAKRDLKRAMHYAEDALFNAKEIKFRTGEVRALIKIGTLNNDLGEPESAVNNYEHALSILSEYPNEMLKASVYNNLGLVYDYQGDYTKAMRFYLLALEIRERLGNRKAIAESYNNVGIIYYYQGDIDRAMQYHAKALAIREKIDDKRGLAGSYNNLGLLCSMQNRLEKSADYYLRALAIKQELQDAAGVASTNDNLGQVYRMQGKLKEALEMAKEAEVIFDTLADKQAMALNQLNQSYIYKDLKQYEQGIACASKAMRYAREMQSKSIARQASVELSELYEATNNIREAFKFLKQGTMLQDSINLEESSKLIAEMETRYRFDAKQKEIEYLKKDHELHEAQLARQTADLERKTSQRNLLFLIAAVVIGFSIVVWRLYRRTRKQEAQVVLQKQQIEKKNRDITESIQYAQGIQQAILQPIEVVKSELPDSFIIYEPKEIVSGDLYWFTKLEDRIILAAIDCTGHGVPGAFMAMVANDLLNQIVHERRLVDPGEILNKMNKLVNLTLHRTGKERTGKEGIDIALVSIHPDLREMRFAGARRPLFHFGNSGLTETKPTKYSVGQLHGDSALFTEHRMVYEKGDSFFLFSDGVTDQFGGTRGKKYKLSRWRKFLTTINELPATEQETRIRQELTRWRGNSQQLDDILIIGVNL